MSDSSQIIVDLDVSPRDANRVANALRRWLVSEGIIVEDESDSVLGEEQGHRPGTNCRAAADKDAHFLELRTNGVAFHVGRRVFDAGSNGLELRCDGCEHTFEPDDAWSEAVGAWFEGDEKASFPCPKCGNAKPLSEWRGPWQWGFGSLGIEFWNWPPLSEQFIRAVEKKLAHRTALVLRHV